MKHTKKLVDGQEIKVAVLVEESFPVWEKTNITNMPFINNDGDYDNNNFENKESLFEKKRYIIPLEDLAQEWVEKFLNNLLLRYVKENWDILDKKVEYGVELKMIWYTATEEQVIDRIILQENMAQWYDCKELWDKHIIIHNFFWKYNLLTYDTDYEKSLNDEFDLYLKLMINK